jgi:hypothetical protein
MMTSKHPNPKDQPVEREDDLERQPGIGQSGGLFARTSDEDKALIEGENVIEGDVENDSSVGGGAAGDLGRTNK